MIDFLTIIPTNKILWFAYIFCQNALTLLEKVYNLDTSFDRQIPDTTKGKTILSSSLNLDQSYHLLMFGNDLPWVSLKYI